MFLLFTAFHTFYTPVFRRGHIIVWWCPSVLVSVRQSQFSALFSYMLWHTELKYCMSLSSNENSIKFECHQFPSIFVGVMPLLELWILKIHSFPHFSPTCFDILSWNFVYDFVILYQGFRLSSAKNRKWLIISLQGGQKGPIEMSWIGRNGRWVYRRICQISPVEIVYKCLYWSYLVWWNFIGLRLSEIPNQSGCYKVYHSDFLWSFHTSILSLGLSILTIFWYDGTKARKYIATTGHLTYNNR